MPAHAVAQYGSYTTTALQQQLSPWVGPARTAIEGTDMLGAWTASLIDATSLSPA